MGEGHREVALSARPGVLFGGCTLRRRRQHDMRGNRVRIAILGCTGKTGIELVRQALERGYEVVAISRHASSLPARPRLTLIDADARDENALLPAFVDCGAVLSVVGSHRRGGDVRIYSEAMTATLCAMGRAGIRRLVCVSAAGVNPKNSQDIPWLFRAGVIPLFASAEYADMGRMESLVDASGVDWTIVRPLWLRPSLWRRGYVARSEGPVRRNTGIGRAALARFMLDCLDEENWIRSGAWVANGPVRAKK